MDALVKTRAFFIYTTNLQLDTYLCYFNNILTASVVSLP